MSCEMLLELIALVGVCTTTTATTTTTAAGLETNDGGKEGMNSEEFYNYVTYPRKNLKSWTQIGPVY